MQLQSILVANPLEERLFKKIQQRFELSYDQMAKIHHYAKFLLAENQKLNLTGHKDLPQVLTALFADALWASKFIDFTNLNSICDVGTGAGFPGLALKIAFPHLKVFLIELRQKRVTFLKQVLSLLGLENVTIISLDWRTFNRTTSFEIDLFLSKAAFGELEICRMFRGNCNYQNKALIYWASGSWNCNQSVAAFLGRTFAYKNGSKNLQLVEFKKPTPKLSNI
jgi:16S rRNA (guanine(527)-N(7))-methyltransferase RsmG